MTDSDTYNSHHEFADTHSSGPQEEKSSTANSVNELTTEDGHDSVDDICNNPVVEEKIVRKKGEKEKPGIYVMINGFWIPACLKNVYRNLVSRQLHKMDEWICTVP